MAHNNAEADKPIGRQTITAEEGARLRELLRNTKIENVPDEEKDAFKIAKGFNDLFFHINDDIGIQAEISQATYEAWMAPILQMMTQGVTVIEFRELFKKIKREKIKVRSTWELKNRYIIRFK